MNMRTVTLIAALCTTAAWAPARAQTVETSVVKVPQDIVLQGTSRSAATRHLVRRFPRSPASTSIASGFCQA